MESEKSNISSPDGENWTDHSIEKGHYFKDVAAAGTEVIAVGSGGRVFVSTDNGETWAERAPTYAIAVSPTGVVAGGEAGTITSRP